MHRWFTPSDKIGFEPMVLGSTLTFKVSTLDHSVIYPLLPPTPPHQHIN